MNRQEFRRQYPSISSALGSYFHDEAAHDDHKLAREIRNDLPRDRRVRLIQRILADAERLLPTLDAHWGYVAEEANRQLTNRDDVQEWLIEIMEVWRKELESINDVG